MCVCLIVTYRSRFLNSKQIKGETDLFFPNSIFDLFCLLDQTPVERVSSFTRDNFESCERADFEKDVFSESRERASSFKAIFLESCDRGSSFAKIIL